MTTQLEALKAAREYVVEASTRYYDGTNGGSQRKAASDVLTQIDAAIAQARPAQEAPATAGYVELPDSVRVPLHRLWPALERAMAGMVFTTDRAGEVHADMHTLREYSKTQEFECLGEPSLCENPRGCACKADRRPTPLRRGVDGICSRSTCECEREGLGDQCIWLRPPKE